MRRVGLNIVDAEKHYYIFWVCLRSLIYSTCKAHALDCHLWPVWYHHISSHYLINGTIFEKKALNIKCVFWFFVQFCTIFCTILYNFVKFFVQFCKIFFTILYNFCTILYNFCKILYNFLYNFVQLLYNFVQFFLQFFVQFLLQVFLILRRIYLDTFILSYHILMELEYYG
jgi:hypothetical protein